MTLARTGMPRRRALELLSLTAGVSLAPFSTAAAQGVTFPRGAIIRTLFKDMAPEELAGGATSFHEHLSLPANFNENPLSAVIQYVESVANVNTDVDWQSLEAVGIEVFPAGLPGLVRALLPGWDGVTRNLGLARET